MAHTGVFHDRLEGSSPNISILPGYYCAARMPLNVNSRATLSRAVAPLTAALINQSCAVLGLHAPQPRLYQPLPVLELSRHYVAILAHIWQG